MGANVVPGLALLFFLLCLSAFRKAHTQNLLVKSQTLPIVGSGTSYFGWALGTVRSFWDTKKWAIEGYSKYVKSNCAFIIPSLDRGPVVVLPPSQFKKIYGLPDDVVDAHDTQNETIQTKWTVWDKEIYENDFQINVIRHQMTRNLEHLTPIMATELNLGFERWWGSSTDWKDVKAWDSCLKLIAGASNGAFCGSPLCRDEQFLDHLQSHAMSIFVGAMIINISPKPFKPISGFLVGWICYYFLRKVLKRCLPFVKERLRQTAEAKSGESHGWKPPRDGLQWIIDECYVTGNPRQLDPTRVSKRLLLVNDVSLHSTSYTMQNLLLDIYGSDPSLGFVEALRQECSSVLQDNGGVWTRAAVEKLKLVDSAIRESMRLHPFGSIGLPRTVVDPHGISLPGSKVHLPQGSVVAIPIESLHYDEELYPNARSFDMFRFARPGDNPSPKVEDQEENGEKSNKQKSTVRLDDKFLGFGFGKHPCPGRFFALNEMKVFIAHMVLHYDVGHITRGPAKGDAIWLKWPSNHTLQVRRRRKTDHLP